MSPAAPREHSFLLQPGAWRAQGSYRASGGEPVAATGEIKVIHGPDLWLLDGSLRVETDPPAELASRYQMQPVAAGAGHTTWRSHNPALGELHGGVTVFPDSLLLHFVGNDHHHRGAEMLLRQGQDTYLSRGAIYAGSEMVGAWEMTLTRMA